MRLSIATLAFAAAVLLPLATQSLAQEQVTIKLTGGATVTGTLEKNAQNQPVQIFKGIRYGEPRTGAQRWTPSKLVKPRGDLNATAFGNICYTDSRFDQVPLFPQSEDCLFLNVYAPAGASANSKLPVMIWTHGGSWVSGSGNIYDGRNLVHPPANNTQVVYVSFNYRLGLFGFLANQQLLEEGNGANFALRDMELAHQWVRDNIRQFGGDPRDVTAFGESAGAMMIALQLVAKRGKQSLFDKAILESGAYPSFSQIMTVAEQDAYVAKVAATVGCQGQGTDTTASVLACLRTKDAAVLAKAGDQMDWRPVVDDAFLVDLPFKLVQQNKFSKIPTILGTNTDEGWLFAFGVTSKEAFLATISLGFPLLTDAERAQLPLLYPAQAFVDAQTRAGELIGDQIFVCPSEQLSKLAVLSSSSAPSYHYRFNETVPPYFGVGPELAVHTAEMRFVFNDGSVPADDASRALSAKMQTFWTNFAAYGSPNGATDGKCPVWPRYDATRKQQIVLQKNVTTERNGVYMPQHDERCAFWNNVEARIAQSSRAAYVRKL